MVIEELKHGGKHRPSNTMVISVNKILENQDSAFCCFYMTTQRCHVLKSALGVLALLAVGSCSAQLVPKSVKRRVTVADGIEMVQFPHGGSWFSPNLAIFSPSSQHFVVILKKGNLQRNTVDYSLLVWTSSKMFSESGYEVACKFSSSSNRDAIRKVRWIDDERLAFLGEQPGQQSELYTFDLRTHRLSQLTRSPTSLASFDIDASGKTVVFAAEAPRRPLFSEDAKRKGFRVTNQRLDDLISGEALGEENELFLQKGDPKRITRLKVPGSILIEDLPLYLSPNGRYLVVPTRVINIPHSWQEYRDPDLQSLIRISPPEGSPGLIKEYILVDTETGKSVPLLEAPIGDIGSIVAWAPDSRSVVLSNVHLPLDVTDANERRNRQDGTFSVEIQIPSHRILTLSDKNMWLMRWDRETNRVIFTEGRENFLSGKPGKQIFFQKMGNNWEQQAVFNAPPSSISDVQVILEEDLNTAPKIVAMDDGTHTRKVLLDLNPQFEQLDFGKVKEISWNTTDGHRAKGGLYVPPDYSPAKRYPVVIQTHGFSPNKFMIDGPWHTAFAAQALAAMGFAVVQADLDTGPELDSPKGTLREVASYEGVIDELDRAGIIDRGRIGIVGFSWTCLTVKYALTHSQFRFAAAVVADGIDAGYFQYIAFANADQGYVAESDAANGAAPFGEGLSSWLKLSPGFALHKVKTPILIQSVEGRPVLLSEWEWFSGLSRLGKPVDMLYLPDGAHNLVKPWEQRISQEATVDWFRFWLKGEEDPDPAKAEQYKRWRELKKLQQENEVKGPVN